MATRGGQRWRARVRIATRRWLARTGAIFGGKGDDVDGLGAAAQADADERTRTAGELKGGVAKAGQLAGYLEPQARARLAQLFSAIPAVSADAARSVIIEDLGQPPEVLFASFDPQPFAAASLGQVHGARGHDGSAYAVKIQFPGIAAALADDLASVPLLRSLAGVDEGQRLDPTALAALQAAVTGELDYLAEGRWIDRFRAAFAGDPTIRVPRHLPALSSARVLTMERLEGRPLAALAGAADDVRSAAALTLFRFGWGGPLVHGLLNADPNPGNYLFADHAVGFLDYGCSRELPAAQLAGDRILWRALLAPDPFGRGGEGFRLALNQAEMVTRARSFDSTAYREWEALVTAPFRGQGPFLWDARYAAELIARTREVVAGDLLRLPADSLLLWRQRLGLAAVLGSLHARIDFRSTLADLLAKATIPT